MDVILIRTEACQRSHHDPVLKVKIPDAKGLEKRRHGRRHECSDDGAVRRVSEVRR
jgi:hypothetical protein